MKKCRVLKELKKFVDVEKRFCISQLKKWLKELRKDLKDKKYYLLSIDAHNILANASVLDFIHSLEQWINKAVREYAKNH